MNPDGTGQTRLTTDAASDVFPAYSPDGTKILFRSFRDGNAEVYAMNSDGTGQANLTNNSGYDAPQTGSWSPGGTKIAFNTNRDGRFQVYVMNANGFGQMNLTNSASVDGNPPGRPTALRLPFIATVMATTKCM
ncbi:MAG: hypothetical protein WKG07_13090 [Hymenobacter sp.]